MTMTINGFHLVKFVVNGELLKDFLDNDNNFASEKSRDATQKFSEKLKQHGIFIFEIRAEQILTDLGLFIIVEKSRIENKLSKLAIVNINLN